MDWNDAALLARTLMDAHGLQSVPFKGNNRRIAFGITRYAGIRQSDGSAVYSTKSIELSKPLVLLNSEEQVRDTILHEIAHAKAGIDAHHGLQWKMIARSIGCNAERCCGDGVEVVPGSFQATCGCTGQVHHFYRMPRRSLRCRQCRQHLDIRKVGA